MTTGYDCGRCSGGSGSGDDDGVGSGHDHVVFIFKCPMWKNL